MPRWLSHLEYSWEEPSLARFYRQLATFSRLILFDKRGTGLSDQSTTLPALEQRMDDVRGVMEAVDSERAVIFGMSEGGSMAMLFAATLPRTADRLNYFRCLCETPIRSGISLGSNTRTATEILRRDRKRVGWAARSGRFGSQQGSRRLRTEMGAPSRESFQAVSGSGKTRDEMVQGSRHSFS